MKPAFASHPPAIIAIGTANPQYKQAQHVTADLIATSLELKPAEKRLLKYVYNKTGIEQRYSVLSDYEKAPGELEFFPNNGEDIYPSTAARMQLYKDNALGLCKTAIKNCLAQLPDATQDSITHLITVSCTGMYAPGIDIELVQQLPLNPSTQRTCINFMGCYGAFNAIKLADAFCKADANAVVLIVSVELCTIHFQKSMDIDNIIANAIFADGAAAVIVQANTQQKKYLALENFHNELLPQTQKEMAWHIGDFGFDIRLSTYVPEIIESGIRQFTQNLLQLHNLKQSDIDIYAIHPGGVKILEASEKALNITAEQNKYSYQVMRQYGNMSSATILFVLKAIWDAMTVGTHQKNIFSCAFGPGLTLESMILKTHVLN
jgi:alpha-pyrone synthase